MKSRAFMKVGPVVLELLAVVIVVVGLATCSSESDELTGAPAQSSSSSKTKYKVEWPACDEPEAPACGVPVPVTPVPVRRMAVAWDAWPLKGRSWRKLATSSWGQNADVTDARNAVWVDALQAQPSSCTSIQMLAVTGAAAERQKRTLDWGHLNCKDNGKGPTPDTRADVALGHLCAGLRGDAPFEAAVLLFDHVTDAPLNAGNKGIDSFANAVRDCAEAGLVVELVAQPQAFRYAYVVGRPGTGRDVHAVARRLKAVFEDSLAHTNSPNALLQDDQKACAQGACPPALVVPLTDHRLQRKIDRLEVAALDVGWGKGKAAERRPLTGQSKSHLGSCGSGTLIAANAPNVKALDSTRLGAFELSWATPLDQVGGVDGYPYLWSRVDLRASEGEERDLEITMEERWSSRLSRGASTALEKSRISAQRLAACKPSPRAKAKSLRSSVALRIEATSARLLLLRWPSGVKKGLDKLKDLSTDLLKEKTPNGKAPVPEGEDDGTLQTPDGLRFLRLIDGKAPVEYAGPVRVELWNSGLSMDCATQSVIAYMTSTQSFLANDFRGHTCGASVASACPTLAKACSGERPTDEWAAFHWDLLNLPPVEFKAKNQNTPDSPRGAMMAVALVLHKLGSNLVAKPQWSDACAGGFVEVGCLAPVEIPAEPAADKSAMKGKAVKKAVEHEAQGKASAEKDEAAVTDPSATPETPEGSERKE